MKKFLFLLVFSSSMVATDLEVIVNRSIDILNKDVVSGRLSNNNKLKDRFDEVISGSIYIAEICGFRRDEFLDKFDKALEIKLKHYESLIGSEPDSKYLTNCVVSGVAACGLAYLAYTYHKSAKSYSKAYNEHSSVLDVMGVRRHIRTIEYPLNMLPSIEFKLPFRDLSKLDVETIYYYTVGLLSSRNAKFNAQINELCFSVVGLVALGGCIKNYDDWKRPKYKDYYDSFLFIKNRFQEYQSALNNTYKISQ